MATEKQIEANRRNAQKSTGPVTEEGKAISARNSVVHGLTGKGIVLPEFLLEEFNERAEQINSSLKPWNTFELWLADGIARDMVRIEDCVRQQSVRRCELAYRAQQLWDDDRRAEAALLVEELPRKPVSVSRQLQQTPHGCALLIEYWTSLANSPDWSEGRRQFALDMLGIPRPLREGATVLDPMPGVDPLAYRKALALKEVERLTGRAEGPVKEMDEQRRFEVTAGLVDEDKRLKLLRRYEAECARRISRWHQMFGKERQGELYEKRGRRAMTEAEAIRDEERFGQFKTALRSRLDPLGRSEPAPIPAAAPEPIPARHEVAAPESPVFVPNVASVSPEVVITPDADRREAA